MSNALLNDSLTPTVRLDLTDLQARLGRLAFQQLKALDLLVVAEKIITDLPLTPTEVRYLASLNQLPILGKLVELKIGGAGAVSLRAIVALNLTSLLQSSPRAAAIESEAERIAGLAAFLGAGEKFYLAVDIWAGAPSFSERQAALKALRVALAARQITERVSFLGPTAADIIQILNERRLPHDFSSVAELLAEFSELGIESIEGGTELSVHQVAAQRGFRCSVAQEIKSWESALQAEFFKRLSEIREIAQNSPTALTWFPWANAPLDRQLERGPFGLDLLRAIALARLLLPSGILVRAPLSLLGPELAHVALAFGANDLGFAAYDEVSSKTLGVMLLSQLRQLLDSHQGLGQVSVSRV